LGRLVVLRCEHEPCSRVWQKMMMGAGRPPRFCSDRCKQANYRAMAKLGAAGKAALKARQETRRQAWESHEAAAWQVAQDQRRQRLGLEAEPRSRAAVEAERLVLQLEELARSVAAARARGGMGHDAQVAFYQRAAKLERAMAAQSQVLSSTLGDAQAALQLVRAQLGGMLAEDSGD
jgi:hypothetical protein